MEPGGSRPLEPVVLLTQILPGGQPPAAPSQAPGGSSLGRAALALGVWQLLLGALQVALGGALLGALQEPTETQLGAPLALGGLLLVSGGLLLALAQRPSAGRCRWALALELLSALGALLELLLLGLLLGGACWGCTGLGPQAQGALLGTQALLIGSAAAGAGLAVAGAVTSARGGAKRGAAPPIVIYQTATPSGAANQ